MIDRSGNRLGSYQLERRIGEGGFAEVYLGKHIHLDRFAAIKVLFSLAIEEQDNFKKEAQRLVQLEGHPHIVRVLDFGIENNTPFLVMDYAPNGSLRTRHPRGTRLELSTVTAYTNQIASALQYVHDQKLIHRDVKPDNVLLNAENEILLSDVGIAIVAHSEQSLTTQQIAGTPIYMAPEQFMGKAQPASDQYALAIMVYEWLSGAPPFVGDMRAMTYMHVHMAPPPLHEKIATISLAVEQVVMAALAKEPTQRFIRIQAFATALEQASLSPHSDQSSISVQYPSSSLLLSSAEGPRNADDLYREGRMASSQGDLELALQYWEQIPSLDPNFLEGMFTTHLQDLRDRVHQQRVQRLRSEADEAQSQQDWPKASATLWTLLKLEASDDEVKRALIECLRQQANQASLAGDWQQEIDTWKKLLELTPQDAQAKRRIPLAEKHQKSALHYKFAQDFFSRGNRLAAQEELVVLWGVAPYYGDPAGLAKKLEITQVPLTPLDYDKEEEEKIGLEKAESRKNELEAAQRWWAGLEAEQRWQAEKAKRKTTKWFIENKLSSNVPTIYTSFLFLLIGCSSFVSIFAQSWYWTLTAEVLIALVAYLLGYRRTMSPVVLLILFVISSALIYVTAQYLSTLNYSSQETSQFWLLGNRPLWIGRQINFGVFYGIIAGLFCFICSCISFFKDRTLGMEPFFSMFFGVTMSTFCLWLIPASLGLFFGWGFGWGFGWYFSFIVLFIEIVSSMGLGALFFVSAKAIG